MLEEEEEEDGGMDGDGGRERVGGRGEWQRENCKALREWRAETCFSKITEIGLWKCIHHKATKPEPSFVCPCRLRARAEGGEREEDGIGMGGGGQSVEMETGVSEGGEEGVAQAIPVWTGEVGTLHCLFNREQISKTIEAHQSFWTGGVE